MSQRQACVTASTDGLAFTLAVGDWSGTYPMGDLPRWLRIYRQLRDRKSGAYRRHYEPTVRALEEFARRSG